MNGNICPQCGNVVMSYRQFFREAEPYKISLCSHCNARLKRSPKVYLHIGVMSLLIVVIGTPLYVTMLKAHISDTIIWFTMILCFACWVLLTNYLSWRIIGWKLVNDSP
ncbi:MAG: hypothetical protein WDA22_00110 [Bacteroidota bacterium]